MSMLSAFCGSLAGGFKLGNRGLLTRKRMLEIDGNEKGHWSDPMPFSKDL